MNIYGEPATGDAFTKRRRSGIGGSDAAAILGVSPWASALGVWQEKRGLSDGFDPSERMIWGTRLEDAVRKGYAEDTGYHVQRTGFRRHKEYDFLIGHPDGMTDDRILEIKVTAMMGDGWGEPGSADIPSHYACQVQHYMMLMDVPLCDLAALVGGRQMNIYTIPADKPFQQALLDEEALFWELVKSGTPPAPDGSADAGKALRRLYPKATEDSIEATPEMDAIAARYLLTKGMAATAKRETDQLAQELQAYIGEHSRLIGDGYTATWPEVQGRIDWKAVAAAYRSIIEHSEDAGTEARHVTDYEGIEAQQRGEPSRRFSVKEGTA